MAASSNIPAVNAKNAALVNDVALDVKKLDIEDAELVKNIALNPSSPSAAIANARRGVIAAAKKNHE